MKTPDWFPDELARAGDEHLDPGYVSGYDRKAATDPAEDIAILQEYGLNEESVVVDLGCGTGTFALAVAPLCRKVVAVDVSSEMIAALTEKAERMGIGNIERVHSGFLTYEHRGDPADFVYSRNALHHLPDFWKALALERISAVMKPGGILRLRDIAFSFEAREAGQVIEAWLGSGAENSELGWTRTELEKDIREEYITFDWLLEPIIERAGFELRHADREDRSVFSAYTCVKAR